MRSSTLAGSSLPANMRLGWKYVDEANTIAYHDTTFTAVKSFTLQAPAPYPCNFNLYKKVFITLNVSREAL
jgi:hypothetical protein